MDSINQEEQDRLKEQLRKVVYGIEIKAEVKGVGMVIKNNTNDDSLKE